MNVEPLRLSPPGYRFIPGVRLWLRAESGAFDPVGAQLADDHYSRRTPGSPQFMPPGQRFALVTPEHDAVWGWHRPHPSSGIALMSGLDGWTCTIFRNTGSTRSSLLVLAAERALAAEGHDCGPDGMLTYVWDARVQSPNPGYCFKVAGWRKHPTKPRSADRKKTLLWKPFELAGVAPKRGPNAGRTTQPSGIIMEAAGVEVAAESRKPGETGLNVSGAAAEAPPEVPRMQGVQEKCGSRPAESEGWE